LYVLSTTTKLFRRIIHGIFLTLLVPTFIGIGYT
jgi:hypothetical protein